MQQTQNQVKTRVKIFWESLGQGHIATAPAMMLCTEWMLYWRVKQDHVQIGGVIGERTEITPSLQSVALWICPVRRQMEVTLGNNSSVASLGTGTGVGAAD
jgi:hypothetical protein